MQPEKEQIEDIVAIEVKQIYFLKCSSNELQSKTAMDQCLKESQ